MVELLVDFVVDVVGEGIVEGVRAWRRRRKRPPDSVELDHAPPPTPRGPSTPIRDWSPGPHSIRDYDMRIIHDEERCARHGLCVGAAPEIFAFAKDGSLKVLLREPPEDLREAAEDAADACPTQAISIED